jgi:hypothetical protein
VGYSPVLRVYASCTNEAFQATPDDTSPSTYTTTNSPRKYASSTNTSQNWHFSHQNSRKHVRESGTYRRMRRKKVRTLYPTSGRKGYPHEDHKANIFRQNPIPEYSTVKVAQSSTTSSIAAARPASPKKRKCTNCAHTASPWHSAAKPQNAR